MPPFFSLFNMCVNIFILLITIINELVYKMVKLISHHTNSILLQQAFDSSIDD